MMSSNEHPRFAERRRFEGVAIPLILTFVIVYGAIALLGWVML